MNNNELLYSFLVVGLKGGEPPNIWESVCYNKSVHQALGCLRQCRQVPLVASKPVQQETSASRHSSLQYFHE